MSEEKDFDPLNETYSLKHGESTAKKLDEISRMASMLGNTGLKTHPFTKEDDKVNSPRHYNSGKFETIDIIEDSVKDAEPFEAVCQANVIKYILRYRNKNGVQDIKKAIWYSNKLIDHLEQK